MKKVTFYLDIMSCEDQDTLILCIALSFIFNIVACSYYIERQKEKEERLQNQIHLMQCDIDRIIKKAKASINYNHVFF